MKKKIISIIIPIYNEDKFLVRCIDSILNQSICDNLEILLVDDGSTDKTANICDSYAKQYENIIVIHKDNEGQGKARNKALSVATGEWVGFVDADDYVEEVMYEELYKLAVDNNADMVSCLMSSANGVCDYKPGNYIEFIGVKEIAHIAFGMVGMKPQVKMDMIYGMSVCRSIFKLSIIKENKIEFLSEREISSEDLIFNLNYLLYTNKLIYSMNRLYHYCYNGNSTTHTFSEEIFEKDKKLVQLTRNILMKFGTEEDVNLSVERMLLTRVRIDILNCVYSIKLIGFINVYKILNRYINDKEVRYVIKKYPGKLLTGNRKLVFYLLKFHLTLLLLLVSYIFGKKKNRIKDNSDN